MIRVPGRLVALEGIDRAGKSSLVKRIPPLLTGCLRTVLTCGERQSPIGHYLAPDALTTLSPFLKTYLFAADRAWVFERQCLPALELGGLVVWDRYFASAIAYRSVDLTESNDLFDMTLVENINAPFPVPHLTVLIDVSTDSSAVRARREGLVEPYSTGYLEHVRQAYLDLARRWPTVIVDGEQEPEQVAREVAQSIRTKFPRLFDEA